MDELQLKEKEKQQLDASLREQCERNVKKKSHIDEVTKLIHMQTEKMLEMDERCSAGELSLKSG